MLLVQHGKGVDEQVDAFQPTHRCHRHHREFTARSGAAHSRSLDEGDAQPIDQHCPRSETVAIDEKLRSSSRDGLHCIEGISDLTDEGVMPRGMSVLFQIITVGSRDGVVNRARGMFQRSGGCRWGQPVGVDEVRVPVVVPQEASHQSHLDTGTCHECNDRSGEPPEFTHLGQFPPQEWSREGVDDGHRTPQRTGPATPQPVIDVNAGQTRTRRYLRCVVLLGDDGESGTRSQPVGQLGLQELFPRPIGEPGGDEDDARTCVRQLGPIDAGTFPASATCA